MPGNQPIRIPQTAQIVESPPRRQARAADPRAMVTFGAGGDLTKRLVMPALDNLSRAKAPPEKFAWIGVDLAEGTAESWRGHRYDMLKSFVGNAAAEFGVDRIDAAAWKRLAEKMSYVQGDLGKPGLHAKIRGTLGEAEKTHGTQGTVIFYLAVAERFFWYRGGATRQGDADQSGPRQQRDASVLAPRGDREAVRPWPGFGARAECPHPAHAAREPDLPHRPLSGKRRRCRRPARRDRRRDRASAAGAAR